MSGNKEIERKFVVFGRPDGVLSDSKRIEQKYLPLQNPMMQLRLRRKGLDKLMEIKMRTGVDGERFETDPPFIMNSHPEIFEALWETCTKEGGIDKERFPISNNDAGVKEIVFDVYHGNLEGRSTLEVEFLTAGQMAAWQPPAWMCQAGYKEVTGDERYDNDSLAEKGWPED